SWDRVLHSSFGSTFHPNFGAVPRIDSVDWEDFRCSLPSPAARFSRGSLTALAALRADYWSDLFLWLLPQLILVVFFRVFLPHLSPFPLHGTQSWPPPLMTALWILNRPNRSRTRCCCCHFYRRSCCPCCYFCS
ncbi:unnamed protein product, partial [Pylaiella littoralis]